MADEQILFGHLPFTYPSAFIKVAGSGAQSPDQGER
jgi:hypothetical protein